MMPYSKPGIKLGILPVHYLKLMKWADANQSGIQSARIILWEWIIILISPGFYFFFSRDGLF